MANKDNSRDPEIIDGDATRINPIPSSSEGAMMKLTPKEMIAAARLAPRDLPAIVAEIKSEIALIPAFAKTIVYVKPVGKKEGICKKCNASVWAGKKECHKCGSKEVQEGPTEFHSDLSVRAAELLFQKLGGMTAAMDIAAGPDPDSVLVIVTVTDFRQVSAMTDSRIVSKWIKKKDGSRFKKDDVSFNEMMIPAAASKIFRNLVLRFAPIGLKYLLREEADKATTELLDDETILKIVEWFKRAHGVDEDRLEALLGKKKSAWTKSERARLLQVQTGIKNNDAAVSDYFPNFDDDPVVSEASKPAEEKTPVGGSTADALLGKKAPAAKEEEPPKKPVEEEKPKTVEAKVVEKPIEEIRPAATAAAAEFDEKNLSEAGKERLEEILEGFDGSVSIGRTMETQLMREKSNGNISTPELTYLMKRVAQQAEKEGIVLHEAK